MMCFFICVSEDSDGLLSDQTYNNANLDEDRCTLDTSCTPLISNT